MSGIPSNIIGPLVQPGMIQQQAAREVENERDQQDKAIQDGDKRKQRSVDGIDEADFEMQVNSDSEGSGSQGRPFDEQHGEELDGKEQREGEGGEGIDLQA